jgi:PKD repeat protein
VALEGLVVIDDVPTDGGEFVEVLEYPVNVADGQLTVEIGNPAAGKKTKLCYLHISVPGVTGSPTASASAAPLGGLAPLTVQFTGDGSDPNGFIESYEWDFGDGFGSTEQSPEHTYAEPGIYSAVLTVTDNDGLTDDDTVVITVSFDPALDVTPPYTYGHDPAPGAVDVSVTSPIRVHIADDETGVDPASIVMIVNGIVVTPAISGSPSNYLLEYTPAVPFDYLQAVIVEVSAQDLAAPPNALNEGWGFVTRDVPSEPLPVAQINFQPDESIPPAGYLVDGGNPYDAGLGYGWSRNLKENERNYNPDQRLDTYVRVSNGSPAEWSYDLPPGDYQVTLVVGSPQYTGIHTVAVEGAVVIDSVSTSRGEFVELLDYPVTVTDGQLTVRIGGTASGKKTKICYLHIESLN